MHPKIFQWYDWVFILLPITLSGLFISVIRVLGFERTYTIPSLRVEISPTISVLPALLISFCLGMLILWLRWSSYHKRTRAEKIVQQKLTELRTAHKESVEQLKRDHEEALQQLEFKLKHGHEKALQQLEIKKDETFHRFLQNLEHELKNDVAVIKSALRNLGLIVDLSSNDSYNTSVKSVDKLNGLVAELRSILEASELKLEQDIDIVDLVDDVVGLSRQRLKNSNSNREIDWDPSKVKTPWPLPMIRGDYNLLLRAVNKLLENAEKYGGEGNIFVKIREDGDSIHSFVIIEVIDTGYGIAEEDRPHIFEPLFRSKSYQNKVSGMGLGLALAAIIIKKHGGEIIPHSREGRGTIMIVRLPAHTMHP